MQAEPLLSKVAVDSYINELVQLTNSLGLQVTHEMLKNKESCCSESKDSIFCLKASKLREIGLSIRQLDDKIDKKRNLIENEINAILKEAEVTLLQTQQKICDVETAKEHFLRKLA